MIEDLSDDDDDIGDAFVTLCVHAGIAAADVVCCSILGEHAQGENHAEAVALLARADTSLASRLRVLLAMKTDAGYSHVPMSATDRKKAERAAALLVVAAHSEPSRAGPVAWCETGRVVRYIAPLGGYRTTHLGGTGAAAPSPAATA
jgi:hypothetical protein